jgi:ABC-2 type transport system ATP-binding protein
MNRSTDQSGSSLDATGTIGLGPLRHAGYNVLTWDARGFGQSGGQVEADSPDYEGRDVQALIDHVAKQPEAKLDAPNDPRLGMAGGSYGGGIQLIAAGLDPRIDVIVPDIAWNSFLTALFKDDSVKYGWGNALFVAGVPTSFGEGLTGGETGNLDPHIVAAYQDGLVAGRLSEEDRRFFDARGTNHLLPRVDVPTLFTEGSADTLFTLKESIDNYAVLRANGVPTKLLWFCGGHGVCTTNAGPGGRIEKAVLAWFARYLDGRTTVDTGPRFEWVGDDGTWRSGGDYPLAAAGSLTGQGSGTLPLAEDASAPGQVAATPGAIALNVPIGAPAADAEVVGEPKLDITYTGSANTTSSFVYAQIVDNAKGVVLGNQATPIPVTLDGLPHTLPAKPLEAIAVHATPGSSYKLQIVPATSVYAPQRAAGTIAFSSVHVELPLVDPKGTPPGYPASVHGSSGSRAPKATLRLSRPPHAAGRYGRVLRIRTSASRRIAHIVLVLRDARGRRVGSSRPATFRGRRPIGIVLRRRVHAGRYVVRASGRAPSGRPVRAKLAIRLR